MPRAFGSELDGLISDLGKIPPELRKQMRPAMRQAAAPILADAKRRASWSSRIPGAIGIRTSFASGRRTGVSLAVNAKKAPHARPYERGSQNNRRLRHPVFGRPDRGRSEWVWVERNTRPFFFPAVQAGREQVRRQVDLAVIRAARSGGFR